MWLDIIPVDWLWLLLEIILDIGSHHSCGTLRLEDESSPFFVYHVIELFGYHIRPLPCRADDEIS
jgi:hypothetical protein